MVKNHRYYPYSIDISRHFREYGVNRISPHKPGLASQTRLRRLWLIHTHENEFDQGIKKM
jgi:hypothetical protein